MKRDRFRRLAAMMLAAATLWVTAAKGTKYIYTVRAVADDGTTRGGYDKTGVSAVAK